MEKQIFDPPIPYIGPVYGGRFCPGKMLRIEGTVPGFAYRFSINLQCGPEITPRDDVALQISVRLLEGHILLNSLYNGVWGEEQRGTAFPIRRSEKFEIILMCDFDQYKVAINGQHYCEFPHRIHYDDITHLAIDGDVSVIQISYASVLEDEMEPDEFELHVISKPFSPELPLPPIGFSVDAVIENHQRLSQEPLADTSNPTDSSRPTVASKADSTSRAEEATNLTAASKTGNITCAPPGKPDPFNEVLSTFDSMDPYYWQKCCAGFWGVTIAIIIIFVIVVAQAGGRASTFHSNSTFNSSDNDSYGNDYNTGNDVAGFYNISNIG